MAADAPTLADQKRFADHLSRLSAAGYRVIDDETKAFACFVKLRQTYAGPLVTLARRLDIAVDERTGGDTDSRPNQ